VEGDIFNGDAHSSPLCFNVQLECSLQGEFAADLPVLEGTILISRE
jgi:hypothetical protein